MTGGIIVLLIIVILVLAIIGKLIAFIFKPNVQKTKITKVDENGNKIVEYHETKDSTGSGTLAKVIAIIVLLGILFFILIIVTVVINSSS